MKFLRVTRLDIRPLPNQSPTLSTGTQLAIPISTIVGVEQANYSGAWRALIHVYGGTTFATCDYYDAVMQDLECET